RVSARVTKCWARSLRGRSSLEQRNRLDMRRVREHVDRPHATELVPVVVAQPLRVTGERRRIARDVHDSGCADLAEPPERFARQAGTRWVDDDDVRIAAPLVELPQRLADVACE